MPQDSSKSVVYRSFFSCDDPKGVVNCKTSRKSKATNLQKPEDKVVHHRKQKSLDMSLSGNEDGKDMVSKGVAGDLRNPASVQLREVSRGAHKLNRVIDNLSKGLSFGSQPKDIAKDLLKGALDLQESLEMLGKLQEASQYMVQLKKNHKEKDTNGGKLEGSGVGKTVVSDRFGIERTASDRIGIERSSSERFGHLNKVAFQKPRLSVDGSSRDCYDELREVIRESFARQNLLPKNSVEEKGHFGRTDSCIEGKKAYLEITKLELPLDFASSSSSQSSMFHSHSHESESFDSSMSRSREERSKCSNVIAKLMGLEEFPTKTWQSTLQEQKKDKQLNHCRPIFDIDLPTEREPHHNFHNLIDPRRRRRTSEELIERLHFQGLVSDKAAVHGSNHHEKHLSNLYHRRTGLAEDSPPIVIMKPFLPTVSFKEEFQKQKHISKEVTEKWKMEKAVPAKKVIDSKRALTFSEIQKKLQAEMSPLKRVSKHKVEKNLSNMPRDLDDSLIVVKEEIKPSSSPVKPKMQKKIDKTKRMNLNTRESNEVDASKSKDAAKTNHVNKPSSITYHKKSDREHYLSKSKVAQQKCRHSKSALEHNQLTASSSPNTRKKNAKYEKGHITLPSSVKEEMKCRNEDIQSESSCEDKHEVTVTKIAPLEEQIESTPISVPIIHDKIDIESVRDSNNCFSNIATEETRNLLLANSSFLNQAKVLFSLKDQQQKPILHSQSTNSCDAGVMADSKLLLDCAKELLLDHKRNQCIVYSSKPVVSSDHLVSEICERIANLKSYHDLFSGGDRVSAVDFLQLMLQKDVIEVNGAWDSGWRRGFSQVEIEETVIEIEKGIFSGIIDDLFTDFMG